MPSISLLLANNSICLYILPKSTDMLNKNTLGIKKVRGQSEAALHRLYVQPRSLISAEAKKLPFKNLLTT